MNIRGVHIQGSGDEREFSVVEDNDFANNTSLLSFFLTECDMIFFSAQVTSGTECFFDLEFTPFTYQTWELIANPVILSWWDDGDFTDDDISLSKISQDDIFMSTIPGKQGQSNSLVPTSVVPSSSLMT